MPKGGTRGQSLVLYEANRSIDQGYTCLSGHFIKSDVNQNYYCNDIKINLNCMVSLCKYI